LFKKLSQLTKVEAVFFNPLFFFNCSGKYNAAKWMGVMGKVLIGGT